MLHSTTNRIWNCPSLISTQNCFHQHALTKAECSNAQLQIDVIWFKIMHVQ